MPTRFVVGGALILGAMAVIAIATYFSNQVPYFSVDELVADPALYHPAAVRVEAAEAGASGPQAASSGGAGTVRAMPGLAEPAGRRMQIRGMVGDGSVERASAGLELRFNLTGKTGVVPVVYHGVVPDAFDLAESVTVGGRLTGGGTFVADQLFVQCPSKYQAAPPGQAATGAGAQADG